MHPTAAAKTHALRRIMERLPGFCPGTVLRAIDAANDPLITDDLHLIHRVEMPDGRRFVAVVVRWTNYVVTVMTTPCEVHAANRMYRVGYDTFERIKNAKISFGHDQRWRKRAAQQARQRLL